MPRRVAVAVAVGVKGKGVNKLDCQLCKSETEGPHLRFFFQVLCLLPLFLQQLAYHFYSSHTFLYKDLCNDIYRGTF